MCTYKGTRDSGVNKLVKIPAQLELIFWWRMIIVNNSKINHIKTSTIKTKIIVKQWIVYVEYPIIRSESRFCGVIKIWSIHYKDENKMTFHGKFYENLCPCEYIPRAFSRAANGPVRTRGSTLMLHQLCGKSAQVGFSQKIWDENLNVSGWRGK